MLMSLYQEHMRSRMEGSSSWDRYPVVPTELLAGVVCGLVATFGRSTDRPSCMSAKCGESWCCLTSSHHVQPIRGGRWIIRAAR